MLVVLMRRTSSFWAADRAGGLPPILPRLSDYAGIHIKRIKRALGVLNINGLVTVESYERMDGLPGASHGYRLTHLFSSRHAGTTGRATRGLGDDSRNYE